MMPAASMPMKRAVTFGAAAEGEAREDARVGRAAGIASGEQIAVRFDGVAVGGLVIGFAGHRPVWCERWDFTQARSGGNWRKGTGVFGGRGLSIWIVDFRQRLPTQGCLLLATQSIGTGVPTQSVGTRGSWALRPPGVTP